MGDRVNAGILSADAPISVFSDSGRRTVKVPVCRALLKGLHFGKRGLHDVVDLCDLGRGRRDRFRRFRGECFENIHFTRRGNEYLFIQIPDHRKPADTARRIRLCRNQERFSGVHHLHRGPAARRIKYDLFGERLPFRGECQVHLLKAVASDGSGNEPPRLQTVIIDFQFHRTSVGAVLCSPLLMLTHPRSRGLTDFRHTKDTGG